MVENLVAQATRILIVDDEAHICALLSRILTHEGYDCAVAGSGEEAMQMLDEGGFQLVVSDIMMPGMSGVDLLGVINRLYPGIAVLMVTALDDRETGLIAVELGAYGYIIKPFTRNEILLSVATALKRLHEKLGSSESRRNVGERHRDPGPRPAEAVAGVDELVQCIRTGMDDASLMERFDISSEGLQRLIGEFVAVGKLKESDLDSRQSLSPGTVALDMPSSDPVERGVVKPSIRARDAVFCIKAGMDDLALMKRYGISSKGLRSLYNKLINSGYLQLEELYEAARARVESILADELSELPRRYLAVSVPICEVGRPETQCFLFDITEQGLGVRGIAAEEGEMKTFEIDTRGFIEAEIIRFDALCLWVRKQDSTGEPVAGFQITNISAQSLQAFRDLVRILAFND